MTFESEYILRQAQLFHSIEEFIKDTNNENSEYDYGFNIPLQYDIVLAIYHEVNQDMRDKDDLSIRSHMIYNRGSHGKKKA